MPPNDPRRRQPAPEPDHDDHRLVWLGLGVGLLFALTVLAFWAALAARLMGIA
jgi:hypothetical protein